MKNYTRLLLTFVATPLLSGLYVNPADAVDYFSDAGLAIKRLDFKVQSSDGTADYTLSPVISMFSITGGMTFEHLYLTANLESALGDAELDNVVLEGDVDTLTRSDKSITLGYYVNNNLSVFTGYLIGVTEDDYSSPSGNGETGNISFSENGPFVGANYLLFFPSAVLSLNFAYAFLDGEYEFQYRNNVSAGKENYKGDTTGVSLGVKYVGVWQPQINYYVGGKVNLFEFDSSQFDTKENFYIAQLGISYKY